MDKSALRREARQRRQRLSPHEHQLLSSQVCVRLWPLVQSLTAIASRTREAGLQENRAQQPAAPAVPIIASYFAVRGETSLNDLHLTLQRHNLPCALPVILAPDAPLGFALWTPGTRMVSNRYNIPEPDPASEQIVPGIILCPLLGFDRRGQRLGYGGGYYDRSLAALHQKHHNGALAAPPVAIGVGFACQEFDELPITPYDWQMDYIVTEREVIRV